MILAQFAEAEIDAVLASTRQYSSSGSIDDDHLPPTLHLSQGNVYPDYTPTPINDKPVFSGTALINPHFRNIATLASGIGVAMTQPPSQLVAPQPTYIPQMVDMHSYFIHSIHEGVFAGIDSPSREMSFLAELHIRRSLSLQASHVQIRRSLHQTKLPIHPFHCTE